MSHARSGNEPHLQIVSALRKQLPSALPRLDEQTLSRLKDQALKQAADLRANAKDGLHGARLVAADLAKGNAKGAGARVGSAVQAASTSAAVLYMARALVCLYFINSVVDSYSSYQFMQQPEILERAKRWPQHYPTIGVPYFSLGVLLPCAVLAALGIKVLMTASVLVTWEVVDSLKLVWSQLLILVLNGVKPNELVVKRLAMMGCTSLVLAHSMQEHRVQISSYAGLLLSGAGDERRQPSRRKSLVLLAGRLPMALLFLYVGISQLQRVIARDFILVNHLPHSKLWERDGHDNNWLLVEFLLALPFALGYKTSIVARLLAITLVCEALTCWQFWGAWPTDTYAAHVRLHFVTNLSVAGGLLLLGSFGAGRFTVDAWLAAKKKV
ncbi:hypothetical protein D9Q98_008850 [Chlorella vulgaris]|uniref:Uncharacterized protein n=1 Tax=Chlorella vulgaris TaxID=3077 RepID=A0A9D4TIR2_CHLVU|nr:hypothetical protein D9Q98_008850 [Chlorella vulgaris]